MDAEEYLGFLVERSRDPGQQVRAGDDRAQLAQQEIFSFTIPRVCYRGAGDQGRELNRRLTDLRNPRRAPFDIGNLRLGAGVVIKRIRIPFAKCHRNPDILFREPVQCLPWQGLSHRPTTREGAQKKNKKKSSLSELLDSESPTAPDTNCISTGRNKKLSSAAGTAP
jgi:hypothetical protein